MGAQIARHLADLFNWKLLTDTSVKKQRASGLKLLKQSRRAKLEEKILKLYGEELPKPAVRRSAARAKVQVRVSGKLTVPWVLRCIAAPAEQKTLRDRLPFSRLCTSRRRRRHQSSGRVARRMSTLALATARPRRALMMKACRCDLRLP